MFIDDAYAHLYALSLSAQGKSSPNPNVAAAIYSAQGELISDGIHDRTQSIDHAEVVAIKKAGAAARGATIVISLEPCAHTGATPPCTQAIIGAGISKVIYAVSDPNPIAAGGAQKLREAGVEVEHVESADLEFAQRAWLRKEAIHRPLMIWKVATTLDSKVAASDGTSQWISGPESREDVQKLRAHSDAILIGTNTALVDNPHLIPKGHAERPVRIISGEQVVPPTHKVFDDEARTMLVKSKSIAELISVLKEEKFNQVLVEAGPQLGSALFAAGIIDEIILYQAPVLLGSGKSWLEDIGVRTMKDAFALSAPSITMCGPDFKFRYRVEKR